ncbi:hypothetical protein EVAR_93416_1 [Eumeta japonica]|uniref:Uncharacterized protein n=1 Tax=Eumeta variegata TaxID=151549 RepID=A0A4C1UQ68_EUMVA|nr:hypothetical protein EVAR_93416_1 [Eumeta japonica]
MNYDKRVFEKRAYYFLKVLQRSNDSLDYGCPWAAVTVYPHARLPLKNATKKVMCSYEQWLRSPKGNSRRRYANIGNSVQSPLNAPARARPARGESNEVTDLVCAMLIF